MRPDSAAAAVARRHARVRDAALATALSAGAVPPLVLLAPRLLEPFAVTAVLCAIATAWLRESYHELLERLAIDAEAHSLPAVRRFGERLAGPRERYRLARLIDDLVEHIGEPHALGVPVRLAAHDSELREIANHLAGEECTLRPPLIACCRRLLVRAAQSPLYNEYIPAEELTATLQRIRAGIAGW
jgi:hypothetical protein